MILKLPSTKFHTENQSKWMLYKHKLNLTSCLYTFLQVLLCKVLVSCVSCVISDGFTCTTLFVIRKKKKKNSKQQQHVFWVCYQWEIRLSEAVLFTNSKWKFLSSIIYISWSVFIQLMLPSPAAHHQCKCKTTITLTFLMLADV